MTEPIELRMVKQTISPMPVEDWSFQTFGLDLKKLTGCSYRLIDLITADIGSFPGLL